MEELKKQAKVFRSRMRMLVQAQLEMLGTDDWEELFDTEVDEDLELMEHES